MNQTFIIKDLNKNYATCRTNYYIPKACWYIIGLLLHALFFMTQKFIVNEAYWKKPDGPVFLYISGEGPLSKFSVLAGTYLFIV